MNNPVAVLDAAYRFGPPTLVNVLTGEPTNADNPPTWQVYEDGSPMASQNGTLSLLNSETGVYEATFTPTAANGFDAGKDYTILIEAQVDGVLGKYKVGFVVDARVTSRLATSGYTAAPTVGAIRDELERPDGALDIINENIITTSTAVGELGSEVDQIPAATIGALDGTAVPGTPTPGSYAERLSKIQTSGNVATTSDVQAGTASIPVNQVAVPDSRTWILTSKGTALVGEKTLRTYLDEPTLWAIDFRHDLPTNGTLANITGAEVISALDADGETIVDGISFNTGSAATFGVDKSQAKLQIATAIAGTYVIEVTVSYSAAVGGGSRKARVTLKVIN